jgi:hypothetical protein
MQRGVDQGFNTDTIYATTARSLIAAARSTSFAILRCNIMRRSLNRL